jgi:hypothetical protein
MTLTDSRLSIASTQDAYVAAVLASAPIAYWPLDDLTGSSTCRELIRSAGALVQQAQPGGVVFQQSNPWSNLGAAQFVAAYTGFAVDPAVRPSPTALPFTIECWYRTNVTNASLIEFNGGQNPTTGSYSKGVYIQNSKLVGFTNATGGKTLTDPANGNDNVWHHVALTYDGDLGGGDSLTLYKDDVVVGHLTGLAGLQLINGYWHIGNGARAGYTTGQLCQVAIYDRALSATEIAAHFSASGGVTPPTPTPPTVCVRKAWLALPDGRTIGLEGPGWFCQKLDLGSPTIRDVVNNRPDNDGTTDRTRFMGSRAVEADITALVGAGARVDEVAASFAPFMNPALRPVLHYVLDRGANPERTLVLRCTAYSWPIIGDNQRDIQLQWVAPDPVVRGATLNLSTAWSGAGGVGRTYTRNYNRTYPAGSANPVSGRLTSDGDLPFRPYLRIYGPITAPVVAFVPDLSSGDTTTWGQIIFVSNFTISAGHFVGIDTDAHSAFLDDNPAQPVLSQIDWNNLRWPVLSPKPNGWTMSLTGQPAMTGSTQVQATWQDRYLS